MFKLGSDRPGKTKGPRKKQLWGRDFDIVADGLDEKQVVRFVDDLMKQSEVSPSAKVSSILKTAAWDAEQIVASLKLRAQKEAEEEAAKIIAQANQEAEGISRKARTATEAAAGEEAEIGATETEPEALVTTGDKTEEPAHLQEEATVPEPVTVTGNESLGPSLPEKEPEAGETKRSLPKQEGHSLYTGEVELNVGVPVDPNLVSKLYNYLQTTPEIKFVRTSGSWNRGTMITVVLDKPIPLINVLTSKIPEAEVTPEQPGKDGFVKDRKGVRSIILTLKEGCYSVSWNCNARLAISLSASCCNSG